MNVTVNPQTLARTGQLDGRHAVVTGGGQGIGAAIAETLAGAGATVTVMGRRLAPLETLAARVPGIAARTCDIVDEARVKEAFDAAAEAKGPIDILVNNAGSVEPVLVERMTLDAFEAALKVNLTGTFLCTRQVLRAMREAGHGRIVNVASTAAVKGYAYVAAYCAAKHGVLGLTRALALETARHGITVNAVCPGYTNTQIVSDAIDRIVEKTGRSVEDARGELTKVNPQNRLIEPEEVASTVLWLCLPESRSMTGQAIAVAGGEVM